jgi:hypothetical protein
MFGKEKLSLLDNLSRRRTLNLPVTIDILSHTSGKKQKLLAKTISNDLQHYNSAAKGGFFKEIGCGDQKKEHTCQV